MNTTVDRLTLDRYLDYNDGTDTRYELFDGELVAMAQPKGRHGAIAEFLNDEFRAEIRRLGREWTSKQMAIALQSPRGGRWDTARIPDLMVLPLDQWRSMRDKQAIVRLNDPPPILVGEIVSESTLSTDYRAKRVEYNVLEIPEYWVVDPINAKVTIFQLVDQLYEPREFTDNATAKSTIFPELQLDVTQILNAE